MAALSKKSGFRYVKTLNGAIAFYNAYLRPRSMKLSMAMTIVTNSVLAGHAV